MTAAEWDTTDRFRGLCRALAPRTPPPPPPTLRDRIRRRLLGPPPPPVRRPPLFTERQRLHLLAGCCRHLWGQPPGDYAPVADLIDRLLADALTADDRVRIESSQLGSGPAYDGMWSSMFIAAAAEPNSPADPFDLGHFDDVLPLNRWMLPFTSAVGCDLIRCVVGNPLRPAAPFDPTWRSSTVRDLAASTHAANDFGPMPVLADALQDAGCDDARILTHARTAFHVRGCWVVEAIRRTP